MVLWGEKRGEPGSDCGGVRGESVRGWIENIFRDGCSTGRTGGGNGGTTGGGFRDVLGGAAPIEGILVTGRSVKREGLFTVILMDIDSVELAIGREALT